jgi:hypothetical protein
VVLVREEIAQTVTDSTAVDAELQYFVHVLDAESG